MERRSEPAARQRSRALDVAFGAYCLVALAALTWPVYAWAGARIEPRIVGLPFSMGWVILWIVLTFAVLVAYEALGERARER
jgi:TRAP-type C4-dicarboxylate transport system permease small subunit